MDRGEVVDRQQDVGVNTALPAPTFSPVPAVAAAVLLLVAAPADVVPRRVELAATAAVAAPAPMKERRLSRPEPLSLSLSFDSCTAILRIISGGRIHSAGNAVIRHRASRWEQMPRIAALTRFSNWTLCNLRVRRRSPRQTFACSNYWLCGHPL